MRQRFVHWLRRLRGRTPSLLRRYLFSAAFGGLVIGLFYALRALAGGSSDARYTTIAFIVISVLLLFPAREWFARYLLSRSDYAALLGHDFHHLDFLSGHFGREALIYEITPELLEWLGCRSAVLALAEPSRRSFQTFRVRGGVLRVWNDIPHEQLVRSEAEIARRRTVIHDDELYLSPDVLALMRAFGARVVVPFVYRHRLLGMLLLQQSPAHRYAGVALDTYAGKAAVALHNYLLSARLVEPKAEQLERETARKIQSLLQLTHIPPLPGYTVRRLDRQETPCVVEFFPGADAETVYLVVLSSPRTGGSSALVLFGMLGCLYSYLHLKRRLSLHQLIAHIKRDPGLVRSRYRASILAGELSLSKRRLTAIIDGRDIDVREAARPEKVIVSPGWRNFLDLIPGKPLRVLAGGEPLLEIAAAPEGDRNARAEVPGGRESLEVEGGHA